MIIHYIDQFSRKSETFIYNLISKLSDSNDQLVITERRLLESERPFEKTLVLNGDINIFHKVYRRFFDRYALASKKKIREILSENIGSILIVHFLNNGFGAYKILKGTDQKMIVMCYGSDVNRINSKNKFALNIIKSINSDGNVKLIAVSNFLKEKLIKLGINESKISIYYPSYNLSTAPKRRMNKVKKIISVGRLSEEKGFEYIVKAFALISHNYPEVELEIYGDGKLMKSLKALSLKINANIIFKGYRPHTEILEALKDADLYIQPSVRLEDGTEEGIATSVLEAISFGLPCIVTDVGGMKEIVVNNISGFVVAERSEADLARAILKYCNDPFLIGAHSENAVLNSKKLDRQGDAIFELVNFN